MNGGGGFFERLFRQYAFFRIAGVVGPLVLLPIWMMLPQPYSNYFIITIFVLAVIMVPVAIVWLVVAFARGTWP